MMKDRIIASDLWFNSITRSDFTDCLPRDYFGTVWPEKCLREEEGTRREVRRARPWHRYPWPTWPPLNHIWLHPRPNLLCWGPCNILWEHAICLIGWVDRSTHHEWDNDRSICQSSVPTHPVMNWTLSVLHPQPWIKTNEGGSSHASGTRMHPMHWGTCAASFLPHFCLSTQWKQLLPRYSCQHIY